MLQLLKWHHPFVNKKILRRHLRNEILSCVREGRLAGGAIAMPQCEDAAAGEVGNVETFKASMAYMTAFYKKWKLTRVRISNTKPRDWAKFRLEVAVWLKELAEAHREV